MSTPGSWIATVVVTSAILFVDLVVIGRRQHEPSMREAARHLVGLRGDGVAFGLGVVYFAGPGTAASSSPAG